VKRKKIQEEERREKRKVGRTERRRREEQKWLFGINLTTSLRYSCGYVKYRSKFLSRCFCCMWAWRGCGHRWSISSRVLT